MLLDRVGTFGSDCRQSRKVSVPSFGTKRIDLRIHPRLASQSERLSAVLWEADAFLNGGDDFKGESLPDITGEGTYNSWDAFEQRNWAIYNVFLRF